jgi:diguanylate cyclase (GGDEF)-like protein/PAS domain S-box-containing protein
MGARDEDEVEHADQPGLPAAGLPSTERGEMLDSIATSLPAGVILADLEARITWANPVAESMFGWRRDELLGQHLEALLSPGPGERSLEIRDRLLAGHTTPFLAKGLRRDGETFDLSATSGVRRDGRGRPLGVDIVVRDVSEELRREHELCDAVARLRARFEQSARPQALLDMAGRFVDVNHAVCELLGWSRDELLDRYATEVIHPSDPNLVRDRLEQLRRGELQSATYETVALRKDGPAVPLQVDITAIRNKRGEPYELAASAWDITELRDAQRRLQSHQAFFRALTRETSDITMVVAGDGKIVYATPSTEQALGHRPEDLVDVLGEELAHPEDLQRIREHRQRLRTPGARECFDVRLRQRDGGWHWFQATVTNRLDDPDISGVVVNLRDIAAEATAERALRESEARYRAIAQTAQEGILAVSPDGEILFANDRLTDILGITLEQVDELSRQGTFTARDSAERFDVGYEHPRGDTRVLSVSTTDLRTDDGRLLGCLAMVSDVSEQRSMETRLRHQALHDALTGLPNRLLFSDRLVTAQARQERAPSRGIAVLFLDLDDFKQVNDTHGHEVGDRLLVEVAGRIAESVRGTDTVARLGGDEFAVICEDSDVPTAVQVAGRIQKALETPVEVDRRRFAVHASIGIAPAPPYEVSDLLRLADRAMYEAKATPKRSIVVYDARGERAP